ncbi:hypothetical protein B0J11DRAFT_520058 [Dendryphion nanum]|uniref:Uncharacterized protein n=1 Tax=Dendryphion nanum TaxID=256645 RepID=A0A9P9EFI6_9PLEO|nr:hypothetical protein B0J11DRAFT_520058 [Dendryphion nanum]
MYMSDELHINFHKWFQLLAPDGSSLNGMHGNVLRIAEKVANDDNTLRYHLFLLKLIYGRVLLTTKQGYIGTGPWNTEVNDRVFLIPGCSLPGIFRTREETGYTVVGAAHIHGVMEGKVWKTLEDRVHDIVLL